MVETVEVLTELSSVVARAAGRLDHDDDDDDDDHDDDDNTNPHLTHRRLDLSPSS